MACDASWPTSDVPTSSAVRTAVAQTALSGHSGRTEGTRWMPRAAMRARMVMIQVQCTWMRNLNPPHLFRRLDASLMGDRRGGSDKVSTGTPSPLIATHFASTLHRRTV